LLFKEDSASCCDGEAFGLGIGTGVDCAARDPEFVTPLGEIIAGRVSKVTLRLGFFEASLGIDGRLGRRGDDSSSLLSDAIGIFLKDPQ